MRKTFIDEKILIVGSGCFGLSSAYHLLKEGYKDVTIIDRSDVLPAIDGSSNDINRSMPSLVHLQSLNDAQFQSSGLHTPTPSMRT